MASCCGEMKDSGRKIPATCVMSHINIPEWSSLRDRDCVSLADVLVDWYEELTMMREQLDFSSLGDSCLKYEVKDLYHIVAAMQKRLCTYIGHASTVFHKNNCSSCFNGKDFLLTEADVKGGPFIADNQAEADSMAMDALLEQGQAIVNNKSEQDGCIAKDTSPVYSLVSTQCKDGKSMQVFMATNPCYTGTDKYMYTEGGGLNCDVSGSDDCEGKTAEPVWEENGKECRKDEDGNKFYYNMFTNTNKCYTVANNQTKFEKTSESCEGPTGGEEGCVTHQISCAFRKNDCDDGKEYGTVYYLHTSDLPGYEDGIYCMPTDKESSDKIDQAVWGDEVGQEIANKYGKCLGKSNLEIKFNFGTCAQQAQVKLELTRYLNVMEDTIPQTVNGSNGGQNGVKVDLPADTYYLNNINVLSNLSPCSNADITFDGKAIQSGKVQADTNTAYEYDGMITLKEGKSHVLEIALNKCCESGGGSGSGSGSGGTGGSGETVDCKNCGESAICNLIINPSGTFGDNSAGVIECQLIRGSDRYKSIAFLYANGVYEAHPNMFTDVTVGKYTLRMISRLHNDKQGDFEDIYDYTVNVWGCLASEDCEANKIKIDMPNHKIVDGCNQNSTGGLVVVNPDNGNNPGGCGDNKSCSWDVYLRKSSYSADTLATYFKDNVLPKFKNPSGLLESVDDASMTTPVYAVITLKNSPCESCTPIYNLAGIGSGTLTHYAQGEVGKINYNHLVSDKQAEYKACRSTSFDKLTAGKSYIIELYFMSGGCDTSKAVFVASKTFTMKPCQDDGTCPTEINKFYFFE